MSKKQRVIGTAIEMDKTTSRRQFLKGVSIGGLSAASFYLLGCKPTATAPIAGIPAAWDKEVDVVVVGSGTAIPATLYAHDGGLKVLILEKAAVFGGHIALSGGTLWIPNNNYVMREAGVIDSKADLLTYIKTQSFGQSNDELINAFLDNGPEMLEWTRDNAGFTWGPRSTTEYPSPFPFEGRTPSMVGGYQAVNIYENGVQDTGGILSKFCKAAVDARGIEVMYGTPGKRLVYRGNSSSGEGEVIGIIAESGGKEIAIKARHGVCLGTGGFEQNQDMVRHWLRAPLYASCSSPGNAGDGHLMCMAVGAQLRNMNSVWANSAYLPGRNAFNLETPDVLPLGIEAGDQRSGAGTIIVNRHGDRIGNESASSATIGRAFNVWDTGTFTWMNIPSFSIFDSGYIKRYAPPGLTEEERKAGVVPAWITRANSLNDLAEALGIDSDRLLGTVEYFNRHAKMGIDPLFHRGENDYDRWLRGDMKRYQAGEIPNPCLAPLETPPYYGAAIWPSTLGGTNGGPLTNENSQVLNVWDKPIPRLYAVGNLAASVMGAGRASAGATLGPGFTFAWIAGKHISTLEPWI